MGGGLRLSPLSPLSPLTEEVEVGVGVGGVLRTGTTATREGFIPMLGEGDDVECAGDFDGDEEGDEGDVERVLLLLLFLLLSLR